MNNEELVNNSILGFVVGDALGVPIEFNSRNYLKDNPLKEMIGYGSHSVPEGTWSDDTSMMLATMDSVIEKKEINYNDIMKKFCDWYMDSKYTATGVTFDIGISTRKALNKFYQGVPALECGGKGEYDNGNGSLMRMLPIVLYSYYKNYSLIEETKLINNCSSLTHANEISKLGCKIYSDYVKFLLDGKSKEQALEELSTIEYKKNYSEYSIEKYERILNCKISHLMVNDIKSTGFIVDTLEASIWSILKTDTYKDAVLSAVNLGEDTDTIGAITGSMAGIIYGNQNIPKEWLEKIKNKEYLDTIINKYNDILIKKSAEKRDKIDKSK